jgi:hypothetical protein
VDFIGKIVRLQVQTSSLKVGSRPRRYDPAPLRSLPALALTPAGAIGLAEDGEAIVDVHHADHPDTKNSGGVNGISLGFTAHYAAMRDRFGEHLSDGIAGENILVETERSFSDEDLAAGIVITGDDGARLELDAIVVAAPCVEFTRFALRFPDGARPDATVTEALRFLDDGRRGFYAAARGAGGVLKVGDRVFVAPPGRLGF